MFEYIIIIILTNVFWIILIKKFPKLIFKLCQELIMNDKVYIRGSVHRTNTLGLYSSINIDKNIEIIKFIDNNNSVTYFGNFILESKNKMITNCNLRKKVDGYYLIAKRDIASNEELVIELY